jgi:hypothetical protein
VYLVKCSIRGWLSGKSQGLGEIGSCGVPRPSLADYVTVKGDPRMGRSPPEGARVAFYEAAGRVNS